MKYYNWEFDFSETCEKPFYRRYGVRNHTCCDVSQLSSDVCGISSSQLGISKTTSRIVGGSTSLKETWPWMVRFYEIFISTEDIDVLSINPKTIIRYQ